MERFCDDCDALLIQEAGDETTGAEKLYRCPDCGARWALDPSNYMRPLE